MKLTRREFVVAGGAGLLSSALPLAPGPVDVAKLTASIKDPEIRTGFDVAARLNVLPAVTQHAYPGYFNITADGGSYGGDATWPGLDSWQMAGALLLLGQTQVVLDYFAFVRASQRHDGNIPFAIFTGDTRPGTTFLRGMRYPDDAFTYKPPVRRGVPESAQQTKEWVGLFRHWELRSEPLATLGPICYLLTADEIYTSTHDRTWLAQNIDSLEATAAYLASRITDNGLLAGSGFYTELPPRYGWDGVTQCYAVSAFRRLAALARAVGRVTSAGRWAKAADDLAKQFRSHFWVNDHFAEYIHIDHGVVDVHGLSDTNWAALAFDVVDRHQSRTLWPRLQDKAFWWGGVPTLTVTKPFAYESWEADPVPFGVPSLTNDVAAMGRVWYLEALARQRMGDHDLLAESTRLVCKTAKDGGWRERYHPLPNGTTQPAGAEKYCEYPSVLIRTVLGNRRLFTN